MNTPRPFHSPVRKLSVRRVVIQSFGVLSRAQENRSRLCPPENQLRRYRSGRSSSLTLLLHESVPYAYSAAKLISAWLARQVTDELSVSFRPAFARTSALDRKSHRSHA